MLNLDQYNSLGAALREALDRWPNETCLIESDRDKEKTRLTYSDFKEMALPLARALEDAEFGPGDRAARKTLKSASASRPRASSRLDN